MWTKRARRTGLGAAVLLSALTAVAAPKPARDARALYNGKCALCHGRDGKANPALAHAKVRDFTDREWQKERTDEAIRKSIEDGREGSLMRGYKDQLSEAELLALVKLVRAFGPSGDGTPGHRSIPAP